MCSSDLYTLTRVAGTPNGDLFSEHVDDVRIQVAVEMRSFSAPAVDTDSRNERVLYMMGAGAGFTDDDEEDFGGEELTGATPQTYSQTPVLPAFMPGALPGTEQTTGSGANGPQQMPFVPPSRTPLGSPGVRSTTGRVAGVAAIEDSDSGEDDQTVRKAYGKAPKFSGSEKDWSDWSWRYCQTP